MAIALSAAGALAAITAAVVYQVDATRPVGEGALFQDDARQALAVATESGGLPRDQLARLLRNQLEIEAVSVVDETGRIAASSAPAWAGLALDGLLGTGFDNGWFVAIAQPVKTAVTIDGIVEWEQGEVLYDVYQPHPAGGGLILSYDISELLARRASRTGIQGPTVLIGGAGLALAAMAGVLALGRAGARRRLETSDFHRRVLVVHNEELAVARAQAERALALAEETNRIRSEFVLMINHELRTPLTSVVTGAELLADMGESMSESERASLLSDLLADGRRLSGLISQMLTVARIENQGLSYATRAIPASVLLQHMADATPRVEMDLMASQESAVVETDPEGLVMLLCSLADNAFTHGASRVRLEVSGKLGFEPAVEVGERPESALFFHVVDNGPGIPADFLDRAFEKFEKAGRAAGTGLGLYVARMMVEAIGGSISIRTGRDGTHIAVGVPLALDRATTGSLI